ncbi:hypothetical protein [Bacillus sp. ISL-7]|uniref:hypothetical protein n=1 Tax=Bacillus sp. ISL-7 TaxID=2819136 RepID=UPI001BE8C605|nr:hypothetical protein [Bacillus sp. ISL-7]MBT2734728.1 hypothetical protein [Bacillus sp. ISL-7]
MENQNSKSKNQPENDENIILDEIQRPVRSSRSNTARAYVPKSKVTSKNDFLREIPAKVIWRLLELSELHCPESSFAICLQATYAIRTNDVCNLRQANFGGFKYSTDEGKMGGITISIGYKHQCKQIDYEKFLSILEYYRKRHFERLKSNNMQGPSLPLFVNAKGKPLTVESYRRKFEKLVSFLIKDLIDSNELELAELLSRNKFTPNSLRVWLTFQLLLNGETAHNIPNVSSSSKFRYSF